MRNISITVLFMSIFSFCSCKKDDPTPAAPPPNSQQDTVAPVISISSADTINHVLNIAFVVPSATANDNVDGDLTAYIIVNSNVNVNQTGTYAVTYSVTDSDSNSTSETIVVIVTNSAAGLAGSYPLCNDTCTISAPYAYSASVSVSQTVDGAISINNFSAFGTSININGYESGANISFPAQPIGSFGNILSGTGMELPRKYAYHITRNRYHRYYRTRFEFLCFA